MRSSLAPTLLEGSGLDIQARKHAWSFRTVTILFGVVTAAFCAVLIPHQEEADHPSLGGVACPPHWMPVILAIGILPVEQAPPPSNSPLPPPSPPPPPSSALPLPPPTPPPPSPSPQPPPETHDLSEGSPSPHFVKPLQTVWSEGTEYENQVIVKLVDDRAVLDEPPTNPELPGGSAAQHVVLFIGDLNLSGVSVFPTHRRRKLQATGVPPR